MDEEEQFFVSEQDLAEVVKRYRQYSFESVRDILNLYFEIEGYKVSVDEAVNSMIEKKQKEIFKIIRDNTYGTRKRKDNRQS